MPVEEQPREAEGAAPPSAQDAVETALGSGVAEEAKEQDVVISVEAEEQRDDIVEAIQFQDLMLRAMDVVRAEQAPGSEEGVGESPREGFLALAETHFDALVSWATREQQEVVLCPPSLHDSTKLTLPPLDHGHLPTCSGTRNDPVRKRPRRCRVV